MLSEESIISERTMAYLDAVETYGSMRGAAECLNVNVSTISRQIALMQRQLQLSLVFRSGRTVTLTEVGRAMVEYHRERERAASRFRRQLEEYRSLRRGRLTLGVAEGFVNDLVAGVLKQFIKRYPDITVDLRSDSLSELLRMVREDKVDMCLTVGILNDPALVVRRFQSEPLCAVVAASHPLAERDSVSASEIAEERLIFMPESYSVQKHIDAIMQAEQLMPIPQFRCDRFSTALTLATEQLGVAFMTRRAANRQIASGDVRAIPLDHPIARAFDRYIVTRAGRRLSPASNFLWKEIVRVMLSV